MRSTRTIAGAIAIAVVLLMGLAALYTDTGQVVVTKLLIHRIPAPRVMPEPPVTAWTPEGSRYAMPQNAVIGDGGVWRERHGNGRNSDETLLAGAPTFGPARVIAPDELHFTAVAFDRDSNVYTGVNFATDGTFLVSYDIHTGKERWRLMTKKSAPSGGVPIILEDPDHGGEVVYFISRDEAVAVRTDGTVLWRVATGLPPIGAGTQDSIMWGPSYNPRLDVITGVTGGGELVAFDRKTGKLLTPTPLMLPGAPSPARNFNIPASMMGKIAAGFRKALGHPIPPHAIEGLLRVVEGEGVKVANYHSVDPQTGRMWLSATAPDDADGKADGVSQFGALYGLDLTRNDDGSLALKIGCSAYFKDGSATTPGLSADGTRVYIADGQSNLLAYDENCKKLWSLDVGGQIVASPSVAMDNGEVFVVTTAALIKVIDEKTRGSIAWSADFDMYDAPYPLVQKNLLTAAIAANGIYAEAGLGILVQKHSARPGFLPFRTGGVRIDRASGKVLWYAEGTGDSTAVTEIAPDGSLVVPLSPIRSIFAEAAVPGYSAKITGGIAVFPPLRQDLLARDAACAAAKLVSRASEVKGGSAYLPQAKLLIDQAIAAADAAGTAVAPETVADLQGASTMSDEAITPEAATSLNAGCAALAH